MYLDHFKLSHKPFSLTPDPAFLYLSPTHREALGHMLYGLQNRTGFIAVIGEVGTGKTTLLRSLLSQLEEQDYQTAFIFNPRVSSLELLRGIMREFGLETGGGRDEMLNALNHFLLEQNSAGRTVVLVIDEAQNLGPAALEEVRLLSNLETETDKLLQIVLVGQPELATTLEDRRLRQLRQRITVFYRLLPLTVQECLAYAGHRIEVAGGRPEQLFSSSALSMACRACGGIPRVLNLMLDRALLTAYSVESRTVSASHMRQALRDLRRPMRPSRFRYLPWLVTAAALLACFSYYIPSLTIESAQVRTAVSAATAAQEQNIHPLVEQLARTSSLASRNQAISALLRRWGREPLLHDTAAPVEQIFSSRQMRLHHFQGGVDGFLSLNSPALLPVKFPGLQGQRFVAVVAAQNGHFRVVPGFEPNSSLDISELTTFWSGTAIIPWVDATNVSSVLQLGDRGYAVGEVQKRLLGAGFFAGVFDGHFAQDTREAVMAFQRACGLPVDGRVGPQTLIRLYQAGGMDSPVRLDDQVTLL